MCNAEIYRFWQMIDEEIRSVAHIIVTIRRPAQGTKILPIETFHEQWTDDGKIREGRHCV